MLPFASPLGPLYSHCASAVPPPPSPPLLSCRKPGSGSGVRETSGEWSNPTAARFGSFVLPCPQLVHAPSHHHPRPSPFNHPQPPSPFNYPHPSPLTPTPFPRLELVPVLTPPPHPPFLFPPCSHAALARACACQVPLLRFRPALRMGSPGKARAAARAEERDGDSAGSLSI